MNRTDTVVGVVLIALAALVFIHTAGYPQAQMAVAGMGPAFYPRLLAGGFLVFGLLLVIRAVREPATKATSFDARVLVMVGLVFALIVSYVAALHYLGFPLATLFFAVAFMRMLGLTSGLKVVLLSVLVTAILFTVFVVLLKMPLPSGVMIGGK